MKLNDAFFGAFLSALGAFVLWKVQSFPAIPGQQYGAGAFPGLIAAGLLAVGTLLVLSGLRRRAAAWTEFDDWIRSPRHVVALAVILLGMVVYILWADDVGFLLLAPAILAAWMLVLGVRPLPAVMLSIVGSLVIWYAFYKLLRVPLPWGVLKPFAF